MKRYQSNYLFEGVLQQCSVPSKFTGFDRSGSQTPQQNNNIQPPQEDYGEWQIINYESNQLKNNNALESSNF